MISTLILTKNEEKDIEGCLKSLLWCDDIHVFDSYSDDKTVQIAIDNGARVTQRKFTGYATQRNAALTELVYRHEWILILDADERVPPALADEMYARIKNENDSVNAFRIRRRDYMGKTWLKHAQISPFYIRLVRKGKAHYHREINEVIQIDGNIQDLNGYFDHYPFSKGLTSWISKHNNYSSLEAERWIAEYTGNMKFSFRKAVFNADFNEKRYHQKGIFYKLPCRPVLKWCYMVFIRLSFLDGVAGLTYATLQAIYEYFIVLKTKELIKNRDR